MGFTFIASTSGVAASGFSQVDCDDTLNIQTGDVLVAAVSWELYTRTITSIKSTDDDNAFTVDDVYSFGNIYGHALAWRLVGEENSAATIRAVLSDNGSYLTLIVMQFRPDAGETISVDAGPNPDGANSVTTMESGSIDPSGTDIVVFGAAHNFGSSFGGDQYIGADLADGEEIPNSYAGGWYKIYSSDQGSITASSDSASTSDWVCDVIAIKSVSSGPTAYTLEVDHILHGHILNELFLTQKNVLSVDDLLHKHLLDGPTITQAVSLVVESILHGHLLGEPALTQAQQLAVDNILHGHLLDDISLTQAQLLSLDDILHGHKVDDVALTLKGIVNLLVDSVLHGHSIDGLSLTQKMQLAVDDVFHGHAIDNISLGGALTLIVADVLHSHITGEPTVTQAFSLFIEDINHAHAVDGIALTQAQLLVVDDVGHRHSLGEISLSQKQLLVLENILHGHSVDDVGVNFVTAQGVMTVTISGLSMEIDYTAKKAEVTYTPNKMEVTYEGQNG